MEWSSQLGVVLITVLVVRSDNISVHRCASNDDCLPQGCCLANFVNDEESRCQLLGKSEDPCDTTLSVHVLGAEGEDVASKNKYLGHCPCRKDLVCTKVHNVSHCAFITHDT